MLKITLLLTLISGISFATPTILEVKNKKIIVNGKSANVLTIEQPDGTWGYYAKAGENFDVTVKNDLNESTVIHWHGLDLPNDQDGTELTQKRIPPHGQYSYKFKILNTGTFWMHSHYKMQEVSLAEAPLIIESSSDENYKQVVIMFQDFSFKSPEKILSSLTNAPVMDMDMSKANSKMANMDMSNMKMDMHNSSSPMGKMKHMDMDLNDVSYDAFLTNYHTPDNPQIVKIVPNSKIKLRFINGSASSNFWINLGKLDGTAVAIDGRDILPYHAKKYQLSEGQRIDIVLTIPKSGGVFPIIGQVEGLKSQTGIILATNDTKAKIPKNAAKVSPPFDDTQELQLKSTEKFVTKPIDKIIKYNLTGTMSPYGWQINNQAWPNITPQIIKSGQRVEIDFINNSMMEHPMHIHGYGFKVVEVNGHKIDGAIRDTVLVLPNETVKVVFDATNNGKWFLHCHIVWHMPTGMMTYIEVTP